MNPLGSRCDSGWWKKKFFKKNKNIAPANYTAEVVCIDQILPKSTWLNQKLIFYCFIYFCFKFNCFKLNNLIKEIIVRNLLNTILFINEHGSIRSKWRFILCLKINRSLSILNVWDFKINHFKKIKKHSSSELYRWGCLHWSNNPEEYLAESGIDFLIIFFVAQFERNLILHVNVKKMEKRKLKKLLCVIF